MTHAHAGLAGATSRGSPSLPLAGRTSRWKRLTGTFQDVDGRAIAHAVTKWTETALDADRIPTYLEAAWRRMVAGRPGAVMVELPHDVLTSDADAPIRAVLLPEPAGASPTAVRP